LNPDAMPELLKLMGDADPAVRFWGALGLHIRGEAAVKSNQAFLIKSLTDDSASVRIAAVQALGTYGDGDALASSLETLGKLASPEANGVLTSMAALAAIEALGTNAKPLHSILATMNPSGASPDQRYGSYVPRLIQNIVPEATPTKGKGKKAKKNPNAAQ
jgi:HEAT repeat protein